MDEVGMELFNKSKAVMAIRPTTLLVIPSKNAAFSNNECPQTNATKHGVNTATFINVASRNAYPKPPN